MPEVNRVECVCRSEGLYTVQRQPRPVFAHTADKPINRTSKGYLMPHIAIPDFLATPVATAGNCALSQVSIVDLFGDMVREPNAKNIELKCILFLLPIASQARWISW